MSERGDGWKRVGDRATGFGRGVRRVLRPRTVVIVLAAVAINADLTKAEVNKMAQMAHDGLARTIRPAHTMLDGDTIFALATGDHKVDVTTAGAFAAEALSIAVLRAVRAAAPAGGLPGLKTDGATA